MWMRLPTFLVWLVGLVIALVRWRRHPRISLLTCVALVVLGIQGLIVPVIRFWIQISDLPVSQMGYRFAVLNVVSGIVSAVGWILILVAVFTKRSGGPRYRSNVGRLRSHTRWDGSASSFRGDTAPPVGPRAKEGVIVNHVLAPLDVCRLAECVPPTQ